jgi:hypothetical protein
LRGGDDLGRAVAVHVRDDRSVHAAGAGLSKRRPRSSVEDAQGVLVGVDDLGAPVPVEVEAGGPVANVVSLIGVPHRLP